MLKLRPARPEDLAAVEQLYRQLYLEMARLQPDQIQAAWPDRGFLLQSMQEDRSALLLAEQDGQILGLALVTEQETPPFSWVQPHRYGYLMDLVVDLSARGSGVGSSLLAEVKAWSMARRLDYLELTVLEGNARAAALYRREGFLDCEHRMRCQL